MDWFDYIFNLIAVIASVLAVHEGMQLLVLRGKSRSAVVTLVLGVACCIGWASINYFKYHVLTETVATLQNNKPKTPPRQEWNSSLTGKQIEDIGLSLARSEYFRTGTLSAYEGENKTSKQFHPSQADVSEREQYVANLTQIQMLAQARRSDAFAICLWVVIAAMFGSYSGRKVRNER